MRNIFQFIGVCPDCKLSHCLFNDCDKYVNMSVRENKHVLNGSKSLLLNG